MTRRRAFLASVTAAFLAGCNSGGDGGNSGDGGDSGDGTSGSSPDDGGNAGGATATDGRTPTETETETDGDGGDGLSRITESESGGGGDGGDGGLDKGDGGDGSDGKDGSDGSDGEDGEDRTPTPTERRGTPEGEPNVILDERIRIPDGEWRRINLQVDQPVTLQYSFRTMRIRIDSFVMSGANYELFEEDQRTDYVEGGNVLDSTSGDVVVDLEPLDDQNYVLVFDNSQRGEADPDRNAAVEDEVNAVVRVVLYE